ncbi:MAG: hypothetical protein ABSD42_02465 [Candidatus Bathyarchaeia archaeon]
MTKEKMYPLFAVIMLAISAIMMFSGVAAIRFGSKRMQFFMKIMKAVMALDIIIGVASIIALIVYFI